MSNGIRLRQNEEHSIEMLAAQRQLYSNAKRYDWLSTALSVWIPFGMAIILVFIPEDSLAGIVSYIVSITSAVIICHGIRGYLEKIEILIMRLLFTQARYYLMRKKRNLCMTGTLR